MAGSQWDGARAPEWRPKFQIEDGVVPLIMQFQAKIEPVCCKFLKPHPRFGFDSFIWGDRAIGRSSIHHRWRPSQPRSLRIYGGETHGRQTWAVLSVKWCACGESSRFCTPSSFGSHCSHFPVSQLQLSFPGLRGAGHRGAGSAVGFCCSRSGFIFRD